MSNPSQLMDGVRGVSREEGRVLATRGVIADLSRQEVVVHVGKPTGSLSGWVGGWFWQVWRDPGDAANTVRARIDQREPEQWSFADGLGEEALLERAKDRIIADVKADRARRLDAARTELAALTGP